MNKINIDEFNKILKEISDEDRQFLFFKYLIEHPEEYSKLNKELDNTKDLKKMRIIANRIRDIKNLDIRIKGEIEYYLSRDLHYKNILHNAKKLAEELNLQNSLEIANLFTYLLWNGFFSKNRKLVYQSDGRYLIPGEYSHDIMSGKGVCLNFSHMLSDFMNEFKYSSSILLNYLNSKKVKKAYIPPVRRNYGEESFEKLLSIHFYDPIKKVMGNHAFNLIRENKKLYIYDATSLSMFKVKDKNGAKMINGRLDSFLKPYISYSFNFSKKAINTLDYLHLSENFERAYSNLDFVDSWEKCYPLFLKNINLLMDFYFSIVEDINYIADTNEKVPIIIKKMR